MADPLAFALGSLAFGFGRGRAAFISTPLKQAGEKLAALCYNHVEIRVRIFDQRLQRYQFYQFTLLVVIMLRFIIDHSCCP